MQRNLAFLLLAVILIAGLSATLAVTLSGGLPPQVSADATDIPRIGAHIRAVGSGLIGAAAISALVTVWHAMRKTVNGYRRSNAGLVERLRRTTAEKAAAVEASRRLLEAEKSVSIGILVSGVAHELNNPNHTVLSNATLISQAWEDIVPILDEYQRENGDFVVAGADFQELRERMPSYLRGIVDAARKTERIVSELRNFARQDAYSLDRIIEIDDVVREAVSLCRSTISRATDSFHITYGSGDPAVRGNFHRLEQLVIHIIQNACRAVGGSADRNRGIRLETGREGEYVFVRVCDDGPGIPADQIARVTDPFYTTLREEGATGLGLAVASSIVEDHNGSLDISSGPGKGTVVTVRLPATRRPEYPELPPQAE